MRRCSACSGFAPASTSACPHCGLELPAAPDRLGRIGVVASTLLGSAFTMTLMACYGCPPSECTYVDGDSGRHRSDAQVNKDTGADDDAGTINADGGVRSDGGDAGSAGPADGGDGGAESDAAFDAAPE